MWFSDFIIMNFLDDGKYEEEYKQINQTILDGNVMNTSLIIIEGDYGAIDDDDSTCHCYHIIIFYSSPYILQPDFSVDVQVISSGEMVCEGTYIFQSISILVIEFIQK